MASAIRKSRNKSNHNDLSLKSVMLIVALVFSVCSLPLIVLWKQACIRRFDQQVIKINIKIIKQKSFNIGVARRVAKLLKNESIELAAAAQYGLVFPKANQVIYLVKNENKKAR